MATETTLVLVTEDAFFGDLIASTVGGGYRVLPAYGNVKQTISLLTESRADLLLLCYNDFERSERFYKDFRRELPDGSADAYRTIVMCYRGYDSKAALLCQRNGLFDYVVAGPTLDVQRLHFVLHQAVKSKAATEERKALCVRLALAARVVEDLCELQHTASTAVQEVRSDSAATSARALSALEQLDAKIEKAAQRGRQMNVQGKQSILIVDDDALLRDICATNLQGVGYHVFEAGDAVEGMRILNSEKVDLILMDLMLPGLDGIAATRKIRAIERHRSVPIVMLTGHSDPETVKTCGSAGSTGFIVKPIDPAKFVDKVRKHLATA